MITKPTEIEETRENRLARLHFTAGILVGFPTNMQRKDTKKKNKAWFA
jgi:hypothetical protein